MSRRFRRRIGDGLISTREPALLTCVHLFGTLNKSCARDRSQTVTRPVTSFRRTALVYSSSIQQHSIQNPSPQWY